MCSVKLKRRNTSLWYHEDNFTRNTVYDSSERSTNHSTFKERSFMYLISLTVLKVSFLHRTILITLAFYEK